MPISLSATDLAPGRNTSRTSIARALTSIRVACFGVAVLTLATVRASHATDFSRCDPVLTPYEAAYVSRYSGLDLEGKRELSPAEDGGLVLSQTAGRLGSRISETSTLERADGQLRVRRYDREQRILGVGREQHAVFDWSRGMIEARGRREGEIPLHGQLFDPLSYQLALRCDIAQGRDQVDYGVVRGTKLKRYRFRRVGNESLDTPLGTLDTVVVERVHDEERSTRLWFATDLNHLMVRLEEQDPEDDIDAALQVNSVEFR